MTNRVQFRLVGIAVLLGVSLMGVPAAFSQLPEPDHLKCYKIIDRLPSGEIPLGLENQFGTETCVIRTPAALFCAETIKNQGDDPRGGPAGHYLCYKVTGCPPIEVDDQFGRRQMRLFGANYLCTPAVKNIPK